MQELTVKQLEQLDAKKIADIVKSAVKGGEVSPIEVAVMLKKWSKTADLILDDDEIKKAILNDARRYEARAIKHNVMFEVTNTATNYDYKNCNHPTLTRINELIEKLTAQKKVIEASLKELKEATTINTTLPYLQYDDEVITAEVYPAVKNVTEGVKFYA